MNARHGTKAFRAYRLSFSDVQRYWLVFIFIEVHGIAQICVALEEMDFLHFVGVGPGILENEQPVADVYEVDQHSLVVPAGCALAKARVLGGYGSRRVGNVEPCLNRIG